MGAAGRAEIVGTTVGTGVGTEMDSVVVTLPEGTVSVAAEGGGPGAKRPPDMGDGGWTPGAVPEPGLAFCGPSAGPSGAGEC